MTKPTSRTLRKRADKVVRIQDRLSEARRIEAIRTARALALAGLPKRRAKKRELSRTLRLGADLWLRVTYATLEDNELPFGEDRFVLAGIQHLAIEQDSPIVLFDRVGHLLSTFGLSEDGRTLARLRQRFKRLAGLSVRLLFGSSEEELDKGVAGEQLFIIRRFSLPTRKDLRTEKAGQLMIEGSHPYGVILSGDFWEYLSETSNRLIIPLELLKLFIDRPTGWDYLCFLIARCGAAKTVSEVPHEALMSLFRDTEAEADREIIRRLQGYHREIMLATGGRLQAELVERGTFPPQGRGRPKKRWALRVGPSQSLLARGKKVVGLFAPAETTKTAPRRRGKAPSEAKPVPGVSSLKDALSGALRGHQEGDEE